MTNRKLIVIIGITGNQGGSVARAFLQDAEWTIRGISRNTASEASQTLISQGIQMTQADLDDLGSLRRAFKGANLIFSVTDFWQFFFDRDRDPDPDPSGASPGEHAYQRELQQGRNIVDAAASPEILAGLDEPGLIASTLSSARHCGNGRFHTLYHFDSKADVFPTYLDSAHPDLARKTSYLQTGVFMSSWRYSPAMFMGWNDATKTHEMKFSATSDAVLPHLDVRSDVGKFVRALLRLPVGSTVMAAGQWCSWSEYMATWQKVTGRKAIYKQISTDQMDQMIPGGFGREIGEMWEYSVDPGYGGGDPKVLRLDDLRKAGINVDVTTLEDYMTREDYSVAWEGVEGSKHK